MALSFSRLLLNLVLQSGLMVATQSAVPPALIIFGDSVVDVGVNNYLDTLARADFAPYGRDFSFGTGRATGRFSNGRIAADFMATAMGLPFPLAYLDPLATGERIVRGVNFASSASGFLDDTGKILNVKSLTEQLQWYADYQQKLVALVGPSNASFIISEAFYVVSTGNNDLMDYYLNPVLQARLPAPIYQQLVVDAFKGFIKKLYELGARKVGVTNIPPLGCLPSQITLFGEGRTDRCVKFENDDATAFNSLLFQATESLNKSLSGLRLTYVDVYSVLFDAAQNPSRYGELQKSRKASLFFLLLAGFKEGRRGCCGSGRFEASILCNEFTIGTCKDASEFVFWDSYHPTDRMSKIVADVILQHKLA